MSTITLISLLVCSFLVGMNSSVSLTKQAINEAKKSQEIARTCIDKLEEKHTINMN